jgi:hypothetical protein
MMVMAVITASTLPATEDERRAAIKLMRAIKTAEYAVEGRDGKFVHPVDLLEHASMGGVKPNITISATW